MYFDGFTNDVNKDRNLTLSKTIAKFHKNAPDASKFEGTVTMYDSFTTRKTFTLNVKVEQQYCEKKQVSIFIFRFSPKDYDHQIWMDLEQLNLEDTVCGD